MTPKFQNRLVGAIVLFAIGVIFLPDVFDGKKQYFKEDIPSIPLQSQMDAKIATISVESVKAPESVASVKVPIEMPQEVISEQSTSKNMEPNLEPEQEPQSFEFQDSAWMIRLGSFRNHENANALVKRLQAQGFPAQIKPRNLKPGELARVEVGPEISEKEITVMQIKLEKITGLRGQVIKFDPVTL